MNLMVDKLYLNKAVKPNSCRMKAAMDKMKMNEHGCIPTKLYKEKKTKKKWWARFDLWAVVC